MKGFKNVHASNLFNLSTQRNLNKIPVLDSPDINQVICESLNTTVSQFAEPSFDLSFELSRRVVLGLSAAPVGPVEIRPKVIPSGN